MREIEYPTEDMIIEYNALAITMFETKKSDEAKLQSYTKISDAIEKCRAKVGDLYDKAAVLLKELVQAHAFASGNRRTAFITTLWFVKQNKGKFNIKDDPKNARVMIGIRERYYTIDEIKR